MDEMTPGAKRSSTERPYRTTALALLILVIVLLGAAFFLNQRLRPHVGIAPVRVTPHATSSTTAHDTTALPRPTVAATPLVTATSSPSTPTPTLTPRQQIAQAYHRYWQDYSRALYTLDATRMSAVAAGGELTRVQAEVAGFRQENRAVHVRVTHHELLVKVTGDRAQVYDEEIDRSFLIDPVTKQPPDAPNKGHLEKDIYFLQRIDGTWKVTGSLRQQG